ncbi:MAG: sigma-70 family RNA polymerase sigma factor [Planctomycetaceae bacterium]
MVPWALLWPLVQSGDRSALGELLGRYRNYLVLLARIQVRKRLQGKVADSDIVQQTLLEAHRDLEQFRGESEQEFVTWLQRLLETNVANQMRHFHGTQRRSPRLERGLQTEFNHSSPAIDRALFAREESPSQHAVRHERGVLVADALSTLPTDYREAIIGRHFEGLTFAELAERMGRTEDSVQKLWVRGLAQMKSALAARGVP